MAVITIQGIDFDVPSPYTSGTVHLTEGEASVLNRVLADVVHNNFSKRVKDKKVGDAVPPADFAALQSAIITFARSYELGVRRSGGQSVDPVKKEAMEAARKDVRAALALAFDKPGSPHYGKKLKDYKTAAIDEAAEKLIANNPKYAEEAAQRVTQMRQAAEAAMADVMSVVDSVPAAA